MKKTLRNSVLYVLSTLLGFIFIISAYFKFVSIELFELNLIDTGIFGWGISTWVSRIIIGIELFMGILIILNFKLHNFTLWLSFGLLILFTVYLVVELVTKGNHENCNCFGSFIILNPAQSIVKNIFLLIITYILFRFQKELEWKHPLLLFLGTILIAFIIPFSVNPINLSNNSHTTQTQSENIKVNLDLLYSGSTFIRPNLELRHGKHIVAFFSLTCPSCLMAAYKFHLVKKNAPEIPIYFILSGRISDLPRFLSETKTYDIPHTMLLTQDFIKLIGRKVPVMLYLNDGVIIKRISNMQINQKDIETWFSNSAP